jgi:hypothetical protein
VFERRITMNKMKSVFFNGYWYRKTLKGYYENVSQGRLHRRIFEFYYGTIPEGYDVHHNDEDKDNNEIDNLVLLSHGAHSILHNLGRTREPLSEETKRKISEGNTGKIMSPEAIAKRVGKVLGRKNTEEAKQRMSESAKARGYSQSAIEAMAEVNKGKTLSDEHKMKVSMAHKGRVHTEQSRKNMSEAHKGKPSPNKIEPTQEMLEDIKNGITRKEFQTKYNLRSTAVWYRAKSI